MPLTVKECLQLSPLDRFDVLTDDIGLERSVKAVSVLDALDSIYWLKGGELTLTNAFAFKDQRQKLIEVLPILADRGVAALAIKVNRFLFALPDGLLEQAKKCRLPILRMPDDCSYCDVLGPVYNEIYSRNMTVKSRVIYDAYQDCAATGMGLQGLADVLSRQIGLAVLVLDSAERLLAASGKFPADSGLQPGASLQQLNERLGSMNVFRYPLARTAQKYGALAIVGTGERLSRQTEDIIERSLVVFTLEMVHEKQNREVEIRDFLYSVLIGELQEEETVLKKMIQYNMDYFLKYFCILALLQDPQDTSDSDDELLMRPCLQPTQNQLVKVLAKGLQSENPAARIFKGAHGIVILWPANSNGKSPASPKAALAVIRKKVGEYKFDVSGLKMSVGVSSSSAELPKCRAAYDEALKALKIGLKTAGPGSVTHFGDLGLYRILTTIEDMTELDSLYRHSVGRLVEYDRHNGTNFLATLQAYCENNFNIKETAKKLHLHYNSLQYRLKKISEITGVDLTSSEGILQLMIGLKIKQII